MYGVLTIKLTEQEIKALHTLFGQNLTFGGIKLSATPDCDWSTDMTIKGGARWCHRQLYWCLCETLLKNRFGERDQMALDLMEEI